jgi:NACalpha-BTF3-like transcription factor
LPAYSTSIKMCRQMGLDLKPLTGVSEIKSKNRLGAMAGMALTFNRP